MNLIIISISLLSFVVRVQNKKHARIIGGVEDKDNKFPWVISLLELDDEDYHSTCTGSIITPEIVLTAAHCYGTHIETEASNGTKQISRILKIMNHVSTNHDEEGHFHDIAIYKIEKTKVNQYGKIHSAEYQSLIGYEVIVTGFGLTKFQSPFEEIRRNTNTDIRKLGLGMITKCDRDVDSFITNLQMCVVRECGKLAQVSYGDSGGPVIFDGKIVGVNTELRPYAVELFLPHIQTVTVFATPVSPYLEWIINTVTHFSALH